MAEDKNTEKATAPAAKPISRAVKHRRFIKTLRETANVSRSARFAGMATSAAYVHRQQYPKFRTAWDDALKEALDNLEEVLRDRALNGVERHHFHGGEVTGSYRTYSDQLGMFILRGRRGEAASHGTRCWRYQNAARG